MRARGFRRKCNSLFRAYRAAISAARVPSSAEKKGFDVRFLQGNILRGSECCNSTE